MSATTGPNRSGLLSLVRTSNGTAILNTTLNNKFSRFLGGPETFCSLMEGTVGLAKRLGNFNKSGVDCGLIVVQLLVSLISI